MKLPVRHAYLEGLPYTLAVLDEYDRRPRVVSRVHKQTRIADKILGPINGRKENAIECAFACGRGSPLGDACHIRPALRGCRAALRGRHASDRKSTRLNSSHLVISYAVFC